MSDIPADETNLVRFIYPNAVITKDPSRGQVYIYLKPELEGTPGCVKKTVEVIHNVYLNIGADGEVIGVEIL